MIIRWLAFFILGTASTLLTWLLAPIVALFYYKEPRKDVVKRFNKEVKIFDREYIVKWLNWFSTHDNATDEYFWGWYEGDWLDTKLFGKPAGHWTIAEYDDSWLMRYWARVRWMWRNPAYKFCHDVLGFQREDGCLERVSTWRGFEIKTWTNPNGAKAFLVVGGLGFKPFDNMRFGWKANKTFSKLMLADRIISFREKK